MESKFLLASYLIIIGFFSIYSYSQVDLNLTLWTNKVYLYWQNWLTQLGFFQRDISTFILTILFILITIVFLKLIFVLQKTSWIAFKPKFMFLFLILFLLMAFPAFSHDIFNYIFNAKMILVYKANPYLEVAANFTNDSWLRFMRNIHTPAPYAYGWTGLSIIPGIITITNNLKASLLAMKLFITIFWLLELVILVKIVDKFYPKDNYRWWLFALNPLVLLETLMVGHNDVVMMFFALVSFWFLKKTSKVICKETILSLFFLLLSVSIKYATIVLLPLWIYYLYFGDFFFHKRIKLDISSLGAILLFLLMFLRPDQLHSWYLIWPLSFAVLSKNRWIISVFSAGSLAGLFRYIPYVYTGVWDHEVYLWRNFIWILITLFLSYFIYSRLKSFQSRINK